MERLRPESTRADVELMNEWQDECFHKSHDDKLYSLRPIVSSSIPDRNDEEYFSLRSTKADLVPRWDVGRSRHDSH